MELSRFTDPAVGPSLSVEDRAVKGPSSGIRPRSPGPGGGRTGAVRNRRQDGSGICTNRRS